MKLSGWVVFGILGSSLGCSSDGKDENGGRGGDTGSAGKSGTGGNAGRAGGAAGSGAGAAGTNTAGSSSGTGGSACVAPPCGGDVVGTWEIVQTCLNDSTVPDPGCPGGMVTVSNVRQTGIVTFDSSSTYTSSGTIAFNMRRVLPSSCVTAQGGSCELLSQSYEALGNGSCAVSGTNCVCNVELNQPATESGTWTASDTMLTLTPNDGTAKTGDYCIQGSTLHLHTAGMSAMMGMPTRLEGSTVLNRR